MKCIFGIAVASVFKRTRRGALYLFTIIEHIKGVLGVTSFQQLKTTGRSINLSSMIENIKCILGIALTNLFERTRRRVDFLISVIDVEI